MDEKTKNKKKSKVIKKEAEIVKLSIKEKRLAHRRQIEDLMEEKRLKHC